MKLGIIGAGHIGSNSARLFAKAGHVVVMSNSRGLDDLVAIESKLTEDLATDASA